MTNAKPRRAHNLITADIRPIEMTAIKYRQEFRMGPNGYWIYVR